MSAAKPSRAALWGLLLLLAVWELAGQMQWVGQGALPAPSAILRQGYLDRADYPASEPDVRWSPDSRRLVAMQTRVVPERRVTLVESSPADQLQPKLSSYPYLKPGDEIPVSRPHLFDVAAEREIPLDQSAQPNPWLLDDVRWAPDSSRFTLLHNQRGHQLR